jgi:hypothetical protein
MCADSPFCDETCFPRFPLPQTVMTRNKLLVERKQKKAVKGRHGKRLGGVVKRAMKASKMQK